MPHLLRRVARSSDALRQNPPCLGLGVGIVLVESTQCVQKELGLPEKMDKKPSRCLYACLIHVGRCWLLLVASKSVLKRSLLAAEYFICQISRAGAAPVQIY